VPQPNAQANQAQSALWNARRGEIWVEQQQMLDRLFLPFERLLTEAVGSGSARNVLDVGCGAGATTIAAARRLTQRGRCAGLDISVPLIEAARRRAGAAGVANVRFIAGDAQSHAFAPASFDAIISRFGVMFFDDPEAAFANLRRAVRPGASLTLTAWRGPEENPFMTEAERAAAPFAPELTARDAAGPGRFAFADSGRVRGILAAAGWRDVDIQPLDAPCALPEEDFFTFATRMGQMGLLLPNLSHVLRATVEAAIRRAAERYVSGGAARFTAACWLVRARAV
jgi:SAM-dependent methyltransferase